MIKYLELLNQEASLFDEFTLEKFDRAWNERADALAKFTSATAALDTRRVILLTITDSSVMSPTTTVMITETGRNLGKICIRNLSLGLI